MARSVRVRGGLYRFVGFMLIAAGLLVGEPITVWIYPEFRGPERRRVWHAVQGGRVIRDHAVLSAPDQRIRIGLLLLAPVLLIGGGWIARHFDWEGRPAGGAPG